MVTMGSVYPLRQHYAFYNARHMYGVLTIVIWWLATMLAGSYLGCAGWFCGFWDLPTQHWRA
jgi:hypothetical protein